MLMSRVAVVVVVFARGAVVVAAACVRFARVGGYGDRQKEQKNGGGAGEYADTFHFAYFFRDKTKSTNCSTSASSSTVMSSSLASHSGMGGSFFDG